MISKDYNESYIEQFTLVCDVCGEPADETFHDFYDAVEYKKPNGWKSLKCGDGWQDVCPECLKRG
jgi:hypothetical protein